MKVQEVEISKLNPAEYNPRRLTDTQYQHLRNSLEEFGIVDPIVVNSHKDRKNMGLLRNRVKIPLIDLILTLFRNSPIKDLLRTTLRANEPQVAF